MAHLQHRALGPPNQAVKLLMLISLVEGSASLLLLLQWGSLHRCVHVSIGKNKCGSQH